MNIRKFGGSVQYTGAWDITTELNRWDKSKLQHEQFAR